MTALLGGFIIGAVSVLALGFPLGWIIMVPLAIAWGIFCGVNQLP